MVERPTITVINMYPQLDNSMQFRLDNINELKDYFIVEIYKRKTMGKKLSKNTAALDYVNKTFFGLICNKQGCFYCFVCYHYYITSWNNKRKP